MKNALILGAVLGLGVLASGLIEDPVSVEAHRLVEGGARLVDVRTPQEFASGHLEGAVNIPLDQLPNRLDELDREGQVVVYCHSGNRSASAARTLERAGFSVYDLGPKARW